MRPPERRGGRYEGHTYQRIQGCAYDKLVGSTEIVYVPAFFGAATTALVASL